MGIRTVNRELLRLLVFQVGGYKKAAGKTGKSIALLNRLARGTYKRRLKEISRIEICEGLNTSQDELFPFVRANDKY